MRPVAAIIFTLLAVQPAMAQVCSSYSAILGALEKNNQEQVFANGTMGQYIVEFTLSPSRDWSVVVTNPQNKRSCMIAGGERFEVVKVKPPPERDG